MDAFDLFVADLNGDGRDDVVLVSTDLTTQTTVVFRLAGVGGVLGAQDQVVSSGGYDDLGVVDLDDDDILDLAIMDFGAGQRISTLVNRLGE